MRLLFLCCAFALVVFSGCSKHKDEGRMLIQGYIKVNGQALTNGDISFTPTTQVNAPAGITAKGSGTAIVSGKYRLDEKSGLFPGEYTVRIVSYYYLDPKTGKEPDRIEYAGAPEMYRRMNRVPEKYNVKTELTVKVTEEKRQTFDFDLEGEPEKSP